LNALQRPAGGNSETHRILIQELARNYILSGRQDSLPPLPALAETAGAILQQNATEPRPVPDSAWGDLFQFTRRKWSLCGFGELMRSWEGQEFRDWQAEKRKAAAAAQPKPPQAQEEVEKIDWLEVWRAPWETGAWVPDGLILQLKERFGQRKNLC
jgi:hypothetical protein